MENRISRRLERLLRHDSAGSRLIGYARRVHERAVREMERGLETDRIHPGRGAAHLGTALRLRWLEHRAMREGIARYTGNSC